MKRIQSSFQKELISCRSTKRTEFGESEKRALERKTLFQFDSLRAHNYFDQKFVKKKETHLKKPFTISSVSFAIARKSFSLPLFLTRYSRSQELETFLGNKISSFCSKLLSNVNERSLPLSFSLSSHSALSNMSE